MFPGEFAGRISDVVKILLINPESYELQKHETISPPVLFKMTLKEVPDDQHDVEVGKRRYQTFVLYLELTLKRLYAKRFSVLKLLKAILMLKVACVTFCSYSYDVEYIIRKQSDG